MSRKRLRKQPESPRRDLWRIGFNTLGLTSLGLTIIEKLRELLK